MNKSLITLLFLLTFLSAGAQKISYSDMAGKVYYLGNKDGLKNIPPRSECGIQRILFNADSTFYSIAKCSDNETLTPGRYDLGKDKLVLTYNNTALIRSLNKENGGYMYNDTLVKTSVRNLKAFTKKKKVQFKDDEQLLVPAGEYDSLLQSITEDNRVVRLEASTDRNIDIFANTLFTVEYDSIIIKRGLAKLNGEMMLDYFDDENNMGQNNGGYYEGKVHYSPDGTFKIFVFRGEGCGAYCSSIFNSYAQFASGAVSPDIGYNDIITLEKYGNDYLVIDHT